MRQLKPFQRPVAGRRETFFLAVLLLAMPGCAAFTDGAEPGEVADDSGPPPIPPALVTVAEIEEREVAGETRLVGTAFPWRRSTIASEVSGIVDSLQVDEGEVVTEGQVLARLRRDILERLLEIQQADLLTDQAAYLLTVSRRERNEALMNDRVISQQLYDDSRLNEDGARHRVARDEAELRRLRELIDKTVIRAPFSGIVIRKLTEVGEWVDVGGAVVELVDPERMEVRLALPERLLSRIAPTGIRVQCDALPGVELPAKIASLAPDGDPDTRTFPLRLEVPNVDEQVRGGMLCRAILPLVRSRTALFVPKDAVVDDGRDRVVFAVEEGVARRIPVQRGVAFEDLVEVEGTLMSGQIVVVRGNEGLQDGQPVKILEEIGREQKSEAGENTP